MFCLRFIFTSRNTNRFFRKWESRAVGWAIGQMPRRQAALSYFDFASDDFRSAIKRFNESWYESWFFQSLKSGTKYSRISRAESFPVSG